MSEVNLMNSKDVREALREDLRQIVREAMQERQLPILLTPKRAAEELGVSETTIYRAMKIKGFPVNHDFGHAKIVTDQLLDWIKSRSNYDLVYNYGS